PLSGIGSGRNARSAHGALLRAIFHLPVATLSLPGPKRRSVQTDVPNLPRKSLQLQLAANQAGRSKQPCTQENDRAGLRSGSRVNADAERVNGKVIGSPGPLIADNDAGDVRTSQVSEAHENGRAIVVSVTDTWHHQGVQQGAPIESLKSGGERTKGCVLNLESHGGNSRSKRYGKRARTAADVVTGVQQVFTDLEIATPAAEDGRVHSGVHGGAGDRNCRTQTIERSCRGGAGDRSMLRPELPPVIDVARILLGTGGICGERISVGQRAQAEEGKSEQQYLLQIILPDTSCCGTNIWLRRTVS